MVPSLMHRRRVVGDRIAYVGLDVHKERIVVAVAEGGLRGEVRDYGPIAHTPAAVAHHLAGLADIAELLGELQQTNLHPDDLLLLRHIVISVPAEGRVAVPARGENRAPPSAPFGNQQRLSD
jgi:hypothetical protein